MTVRVHTNTFHQADCDRCGWHTRETDDEKWAQYMVRVHEKSCPNPVPPRSGALMTCGCWYNACPGDAVGREEDCPVHGKMLMEKANVDEPDGIKHGNHWTEPFTN